MHRLGDPYPLNLHCLRSSPHEPLGSLLGYQGHEAVRQAGHIQMTAGVLDNG